MMALYFLVAVMLIPGFHCDYEIKTYYSTRPSYSDLYKKPYRGGKFVVEVFLAVDPKVLQNYKHHGYVENTESVVRNDINNAVFVMNQYMSDMERNIWIKHFLREKSSSYRVRWDVRLPVFMKIALSRLEFLSTDILASEPKVFDNGMLKKDQGLKVFRRYINKHYNKVNYDAAILLTGYAGSSKDKEVYSVVDSICDKMAAFGISEFVGTQANTQNIINLILQIVSEVKLKDIKTDGMLTMRLEYINNMSGFNDFLDLVDSIRRGIDVLYKKNNVCLTKTTSKPPEKFDFSRPHAADILDPEKICQRQLRTKDAYFCNDKKSPSLCTILQCSEGSSTTIIQTYSTNGMLCNITTNGMVKRCSKGECVPDPFSLPAPTDVEADCLYGDMKCNPIKDFQGTCQEYIEQFGVEKCDDKDIGTACCLTCRYAKKTKKHPGKKMDGFLSPDEKCQASFGKESYLERERFWVNGDHVCTSMPCVTNKHRVEFIGNPDKIRCGKNKHCIEGECVKTPEWKYGGSDLCPFGDQPTIDYKGYKTCKDLPLEECGVMKVVCCQRCNLYELATPDKKCRQLSNNPQAIFLTPSSFHRTCESSQLYCGIPGTKRNTTHAKYGGYKVKDVGGGWMGREVNQSGIYTGFLCGKDKSCDNGTCETKHGGISYISDKCPFGDVSWLHPIEQSCQGSIKTFNRFHEDIINDVISACKHSIDKSDYLKFCNTLTRSNYNTCKENINRYKRSCDDIFNGFKLLNKCGRHTWRKYCFVYEQVIVNQVQSACKNMFDNGGYIKRCNKMTSNNYEQVCKQIINRYKESCDDIINGLKPPNLCRYGLWKRYCCSSCQ